MSDKTVLTWEQRIGDVKVPTWAQVAAAMKAEIADLRAVLATQPQAGGDAADALLKYGRHLPDCLGGLSSSKRQCTCGFYSAFEQACGDGAKDAERFVVLKSSGSRYAYVNDTELGVTVKRYDILEGDSLMLAKRYAEQLNRDAAIAAGKHKGE